MNFTERLEAEKKFQKFRKEKGLVPQSPLAVITWMDIEYNITDKERIKENG